MVGNVLERIEKANYSSGEKKGVAKGEARGLQKGRFDSVHNLLETKGFSTEDAMGALRIPASESAACFKYLVL